MNLYRNILFLLLLQQTLSIQILFWNLRTFGKNRASDEIGEQLYQITSNYDILLFAEIRDSDCTKNPSCRIHTFFQKYFHEYQLFLSPSLHYCDHTNSGSEEYAILVRRSEILGTPTMIEYHDRNCDFIRKPYGIRIENEKLTINLLLFHSNPNNQKELINLSNVFKQFNDHKTLLLGDLNTGCHYVSFQELDKYEIRKNYDWILEDHTFTNLEKTCPYDRIIATKDISSSHLRDQRVLNKNREAERIKSDHYPISVEYVI
jgi:hypothetical protein